MNTLIWNIASGVLRHGVTALAGILVARGYIGDDQTAQLVGAVMALVSIGWSVFSKHQAETRVETAQVSALMTPVPSPQKLQVAADRIAGERGHDETTADDLNRAQLDIIRERRS